MEHEVNPQYIINSLSNQVGEMSSNHAVEIAKLEAIIAEQQEEIRKLKEGLEKDNDDESDA